MLILVILSLLIWFYLILGRGQFWRCHQQIKLSQTQLANYPSVCAIIPARNEAELLPITLKSILNQQYEGNFSVILIDDQSDDGTGEIAQITATKFGQRQRLEVLSGKPLPQGWTGKLWAMEQGISYALGKDNPPDYFLFTDADIEHDLVNLRQLIIKAETENLALVSLMVLLRCQSFWEQWLIPTFVFFFQKLYPFSWVNQPQNPMAAAAGGCILIRRDILENIGGIQILRQALIDDCSLAAAVKRYLQKNQCNQGIWLGLTESTRSLRTYNSLETIWNMVARTAFTQLNYSWLLLIGVVLAMTIIYLIPPISVAVGVVSGEHLWTILGTFAWTLMTISYLPSLRFYNLSPLVALTLPMIALLYTFMTIDSALRYLRGRGGSWKGRVYE